MKKTLVICLGVLILLSVSALAQDSSARSITINGGSSTVYMGNSRATRTPHGLACVGFYDNICGGGYQMGVGWTISDGSPVNAEWTPSGEFTSLKTGTTTKITVGVGFVQGTNRTVVELVKNCSTPTQNKPCTNPDGQPKTAVLCHGVVGNMPTFGSSSTITRSFACQANLVKGKKYWVLMQSPANSWLAWNYSNSTIGNDTLGYNDTWTYFYTTYDVGALTVQ